MTNTPTEAKAPDWKVDAFPVGAGQYGFTAGPYAGTGYPSKKAAQEAGESMLRKAIERKTNPKAPCPLAVLEKAALRMEQYAGKANGPSSEAARHKLATDLDEARAKVAELVAVAREANEYLGGFDRLSYMNAVHKSEAQLLRERAYEIERKERARDRLRAALAAFSEDAR